MTATVTRPASADELPLGDPLPEELQPAPSAAPMVEQTYAEVPIGAVLPGPHNPRRDLGDLEGMAASIRAVGIQEPLLVEPCRRSGEVESGSYSLLAGHRRLAAAKLAGLTEVPCMVRQTEASAALRMEIALIENLQREDLAPLDEADGYLQLTKLGLSQRAIAERTGCSQSHVSKRLDLLALPPELQTKVAKPGGITLEAAAALARLSDHPEKMAEAAKERDIARAVEQIERDLTWDTKRAALVAATVEKGWAVIDAPAGPHLVRSFSTLVRWAHSEADLDLDAVGHEAEPCHAVMIYGDRRWPDFEAPVARPVCTEPARHGPKGKSKLKAKVPPKAPGHQKERAAEEKRRLAAVKAAESAGDARSVVLAKAVAGHKAPRSTSPALVVTLRALVRVAIEWDLHDPTCALLGLDPDGDSDGQGPWPLERYIAAGDEELHRAALAVAVVEVEERLTSWGSWDGDQVASHFAYLKTLGYELSPFETSKLTKGADDD